MLRPVLTAGLMILALDAPAAADGSPHRATGYGPAPAGAGPGRRPVHARIHRHQVQASARAGVHGVPVQPVTYGERDGPVFHAWLPRNTNLPIYNIPPPYFPED
ncbi:hypothetical protein FF100_31105 [Methylobacterium terricola]|uniref:Uncharacterized protein n=1 Tax=Methylobacterium terricola TaxID=2583531 RepID=A0A5C4LA52_9HYPH|nr:hypothetical protein [Methylobacterium terricola]TNC07892.1 hypothetical protein FF100_31105 [Methylobacterium terricola]